MSTKPSVNRNSNGTFVKGCRSPNPKGRPRKATIDQFSPFAETIADFARKPVELVKNGKKVSQSRTEWGAERYFQQVMAGDASAERFLRMIGEADAAVHARHEEFMQDVIGYKLSMTAKKRSLPPGTPWNPADGPDPDLIIIEDGEVINRDPLFADQHKRLEREFDDRKWQNRLQRHDAAVAKFQSLLGEEPDPETRSQLEEDLELAVYYRDAALFALGRRATPPPRPKSWREHPPTPTVDDPSGDLPASHEGDDHDNRT